MNNHVLNKQLPAYAGFFVLLIALGITVFLSGNTYVFISKAATSTDPKNIQISNISAHPLLFPIQQIILLQARSLTEPILQCQCRT